jgi:cold shock CspA family protein
MQGVIRCVVNDFGFIRGSSDRTWYFFDSQAVAGDGFAELKPGQPVQFVPALTPKGPQAREVAREASRS